MTIRLETEHIKGKASCLPIQEELNDNPYLVLIAHALLAYRSSPSSDILDERKAYY